jgi:predicted DCC family thiol-disulfide oxidoreductase YuxK
MSTPKSLSTVFYDGRCGLCHGFVRFLLARDPAGTNFNFAPLHGEYFAAAVPENQRVNLPDSVVVKSADGQLLVRSTAVLYLLKRLGRFYRLLATAIGVLPRGLLDCCYDGVAALRRKLFLKPPDVCPVTPAHLRARFHL